MAMLGEMNMELSFEFINQTNVTVDEYETTFTKIIETTCQLLKIEDDLELSCIIVDDKQIHEINRDYRNIDRPTDVISFAYEDDEIFDIEGMPRQLGDIFISIDKANQQAEEYGHSFHREFCFLFTHGLLHLLGYDHVNDEVEEEMMFGLQELILNVQKITR